MNANIILGSTIKVLNSSNDIEVGPQILGRVIDAFGIPIDGGNENIGLNELWPINGKI